MHWMRFEGIGSPWVLNALQHYCPCRNLQGTGCWGGRDCATLEKIMVITTLTAMAGHRERPKEQAWNGPPLASNLF